MNISTGIGSATSTDPYQYPYQYVNQYQYRCQYGAECQYQYQYRRFALLLERAPLDDDTCIHFEEW